jgi:DNA replication and repair protein RecF
MHLSSLRLTNFRNFTEQRLELPSQGLAIIGNNGQGKTNLLEAIYYLEIFRSFRGAPDEQLVRFGQEVFRVQGSVVADGRSWTIAAAYDRKQKKKKVTLDGVEPPRLADALGRIGVVIFSPSDTSLIAGSPSFRRRYLDILLSLASPFYLDDLRRFRQVLLQRNSALRSGEPQALVAAWNEGLVRSGSRVAAARNGWVEARAPAFAARVRTISGGSDASLEYDPGIPFDSLSASASAAEIADAYRVALDRVIDRERRQGQTLVGPHRDDLRIRSAAERGTEPVDLRTFGSGGQQRTAAVALRMIEGETLRERLKSEPIILLDDVFAELDVTRSERILEWVEGESRAQVILTAPKPADFAIHGGALPLRRIDSASISSF